MMEDKVKEAIENTKDQEKWAREEANRIITEMAQMLSGREIYGLAESIMHKAMDLQDCENRIKNCSSKEQMLNWILKED